MTRSILFIKIIPFFILPGMLAISCVNRQKKPGQTDSDPASSDSTSSIRIEYAKRFKVENVNGYSVVTVSSPWPGSEDIFTYILKDSGNTKPIPGIPHAQVVQVPARSIVCLSTTHLPYLEMIGEQEKLTGFPATQYISSPVFRERVSKGKIIDLGPTGEVNFESLLALNPRLVMAFSMGNDLGIIEKIVKSGIPVVMNADYMEDHPLGRAEWIKFVALFFQQESRADSVFREISANYNSVKMKVMNSPDRPTVLTGVVYGDTWFLPGGKNYASVFFHDAGGRYLWEDNPSGSNLQLGFETVYEKAVDVDFWIGTASYYTKYDLESADSRYTQFKAFKNNRVYNYSARLNDTGGNEYFEKGYARPDIVLADIALILHPEIMHDHSLYFYRKIE